MENKGFYSGIGSRKTPKEICSLISLIGKKLEERKWILRSGAALGADQAFEKFVKNKYIYTVKNFDFSEPNYSFCKTELLSVLDKKFSLDSYSPYCQVLLLRDINQVLGSFKTSPEHSKFLITWTKSENYNDSSIGGSRIAIRCALKYGIKVYNLVNRTTLEMIKKRLEL